MELKEDRVLRSISYQWMQAVQFKHDLGCVESNLTVTLDILLLRCDESKWADVILGLRGNPGALKHRSVIATHMIFMRAVLQDLDRA